MPCFWHLKYKKDKDNTFKSAHGGLASWKYGSHCKTNAKVYIISNYNLKIK